MSIVGFLGFLPPAKRRRLCECWNKHLPLFLPSPLTPSIPRLRPPMKPTSKIKMPLSLNQAETDCKLPRSKETEQEGRLREQTGEFTCPIV